jgi:CDP-glucose 4,6-dehydratase
VTGHSGFKGGWLCTWLLELGARVSGVSLAPRDSPNLFEALGLAERVASHIVDIRDGAALKRCFAQAEPEIVFHLAAQSLVLRSYEDPVDTFATNVVGTAQVLETARATSSVKAVINITSDKVYENREWPWPYRETDRLGGLDPYSASKSCAEIVSSVYQRNLCRTNSAIEIATARGGNVVGGGDWARDRIVPDIVRAVAKSEPIRLRNPGAVRPWQHVLELCEGYLELGARLLNKETAFAEAWNFGPRPENEVTVQELTTALLRILARSTCSIEVHALPLREAQILRLDISKSLSRLAWRPRLDIAETLTWTADWYKAFYEDQSSAHALSLAQIRKYSAMMRPQ